MVYGLKLTICFEEVIQPILDFFKKIEIHHHEAKHCIQSIELKYDSEEHYEAIKIFYDTFIQLGLDRDLLDIPWKNGLIEYIPYLTISNLNFDRNVKCKLYQFIGENKPNKTLIIY